MVPIYLRVYKTCNTKKEKNSEVAYIVMRILELVSLCRKTVTSYVDLDMTHFPC